MIASVQTQFSLPSDSAVLNIVINVHELAGQLVKYKSMLIDEIKRYEAEGNADSQAAASRALFKFNDTFSRFL